MEFLRILTLMIHIVENHPAENPHWINYVRQEKSAIQYILERKTNAAIADKLHISKYTVTKHNSNVFQKLKVKTRNELARMIKNGK